MGIVEEEADESLLWMELLVESGVVKKRVLNLKLKRQMNWWRLLFHQLKLPGKINNKLW
jgi:hypothetical protein